MLLARRRRKDATGRRFFWCCRKGARFRCYRQGVFLDAFGKLSSERCSQKDAIGKMQPVRRFFRRCRKDARLDAIGKASSLDAVKKMSLKRCCWKDAVDEGVFLFRNAERRPLRSSVERRERSVRLGERSTCHGRELLASGSSSARVGLSAEKDGHSGLQLLLYALELGEMPFSTNQRSELKKVPTHVVPVHVCRYNITDLVH